MIGKNIKIFDELDSTNNFTKLNIPNLEDGTIIVANKQNNGRGRRDNIWESNVGNLYLSILFKDNVNRRDIFNYVVQSSIAIIRTLDQLNVTADIKYPNDCLVGSKKISGILIESLGSKLLDYIIVGVGLNINQNDFGYLNEKATSIKQVTQNEIDITEVLHIFIKHYNEILSSNYNEIFNEYIGKSVVINKTINYENKNYKIINVEKNGSLIIKNDSTEKKVAFSEISLKELY